MVPVTTRGQITDFVRVGWTVRGRHMLSTSEILLSTCIVNDQNSVVWIV